MANPTVEVERYIGGGKMYYTPYANGAYGTEIEIGEVKDVKLKLTPTTKKAVSNDTSIGKTVDQAVTMVEGSLSFSTQNLNKENRAMFGLGTLTTETFSTGDTLPDGTTAAADVTYDVVQGGAQPLTEGLFRFVGDTLRGKAPILKTHAVVTPNAERGYIVDDFSKLDFSGEVLETAELGYFKEYTVAA